jgi:uncharacterized protein YgiM (DUF1202 family)
MEEAMKPVTKIAVIFIVFLFVTVSTALAGGRYYGSGYRHYSPRNYHYNYRGYSSSDRLWVYLGAGILSGILIGSMVNAQPRYRSVIYEQPRHGARVYRTPTTVIINEQPRIITTEVADIYSRQEPVLSRVETTAQLLNIRAIPDLDADITGQLSQGTLLDVIGSAPEWLYVKTESGKYGWVMLQYTRPADGPVG